MPPGSAKFVLQEPWHGTNFTHCQGRGVCGVFAVRGVLVVICGRVGRPCLAGCFVRLAQVDVAGVAMVDISGAAEGGSDGALDA